MSPSPSRSTSVPLTFLAPSPPAEALPLLHPPWPCSLRYDKLLSASLNNSPLWDQHDLVVNTLPAVMHAVPFSMRYFDPRDYGSGCYQPKQGVDSCGVCAWDEAGAVKTFDAPCDAQLQRRWRLYHGACVISNKLQVMKEMYLQVRPEVGLGPAM